MIKFSSASGPVAINPETVDAVHSDPSSTSEQAASRVVCSNRGFVVHGTVDEVVSQLGLDCEDAVPATTKASGKR